MLTGLREALWVPVENLIFALLKVGLLIVLATGYPHDGVFLSWTLPVIVIVPAMNILIFARLMPKHIYAHTDIETPLSLKRGAIFAGSDFMTSLVMMAAVDLLPLVVLERAGAAPAAYFYLAWTIAYALYLIPSNMGNSLIVEAAVDEEKLNVYSYKMLVQNLRFVIPVVIMIVIGAPLFLQLFGEEYSTEGATLLRLLSLSAIPNVVTSLYGNIQRVRVRMKALLGVMVTMCVLVIGLSYFLLGPLGITGVGIAWLASQSVVAAVLLLTEMRLLWLGRINLTAVVWIWQHVKANIMQQSERDRACIAASSTMIFQEIQRQSGRQEASGWQLLDALPIVKDGIGFHLGIPGQPVAVLKISGSPASASSLTHHRTIVQELQAMQNLGAWRALLPQVIAHGKLGEQVYVAETRLPGTSSVQSIAPGPSLGTFLSNASCAIEPLHHQTAQVITIDDTILAEWVDMPIEIVRVALNKTTSGNLHSLERLGNELKSALRDKVMTTSWIHGDFAPENILIEPTTHQITGIVDWELASKQALPQIDLAWLYLSTQLRVQNKEIGDVILRFLDKEKDSWAELGCEMLATSSLSCDGNAPSPRIIFLITWLHHVSCNLKKAERYANSWFWLSRNVESVLFYL
ncbi:MAG: phosphotransferase [Anaerolineae bacterium]|nr:phosphotransferase [Anaerolineae bacterium]